MRPQFMNIIKEPYYSFSVTREVGPYYNNRWHYHPEIELIHFYKGHGTQFVGDNIQSFKSGDVLLVGANLPHYWRFDEKSDENSDVRIIHFNPNFLGVQYWELPENTHIKALLNKSKLGIQLNGSNKLHIATLIEQLLVASKSRRIILLLEILDIISSSKSNVNLASIGFKHDVVDDDNERMSAIYDFSIKNFKRTILLQEIAGVANISPNAFCRYFKSKTNKTFTQFLIELRVGHACKLIIENNLSIKQLCYESGFNNPASFHKYFKQVTRKSPTDYRKEFLLQD